MYNIFFYIHILKASILFLFILVNIRFMHCTLSVCSSFKLFLELEPQLREIVYKLHDSKYAHSLKLLDEMKVGSALLWLNIHYVLLLLT